MLNNRLYGIEDVVSERGHVYDDIAAVEYHLLPQAMGCKDWLSRRVATVGELDDALAAIEASGSAAYIEVMIPESESQPMPQAMLDYVYKTGTPKV